MKLSKWQDVKHNKDGEPYITIHKTRYYLTGGDIGITRRFVGGIQFQGVTWCGYYYIQFNRSGDQARYTRVN